MTHTLKPKFLNNENQFSAEILPFDKKDASIASKKENEKLTYPTLPIDTFKIENIERLRALSDIATEYRINKHYLPIRDEYLQISLALNQLGLTAPAFRDQPRVPPVFKKTEHAQLVIDQIVIDCHWLYCRQEPVGAKWNELRALFDNRLEFNAESVANKIGQRFWKRDFRANEALSLTDRQQHQLLMVSNQAIRQTYINIFDGSTIKDEKKRITAKVSPIRRAIRTWAENSHQVKNQIDVYEALWVARELLGLNAQLKHLAELAGYIVGHRPLSPSTVRQKLKSLDSALSLYL